MSNNIKIFVAGKEIGGLTPAELSNAEVTSKGESPRRYFFDEAELEWITEAMAEGYTKKFLAKKYGMSLYRFNKAIGHEN